MLQFLDPIYFGSLHVLFLFIWCMVGGLVGYRLLLSRSYHVDLALLLTAGATTIAWVYFPFGSLNILVAFLTAMICFRYLKKALAGDRKSALSWEKAILTALILLIIAYVLDYVVGEIISALPI